MKLHGERVKHKVFGVGTITGYEKDQMTVLFDKKNRTGIFVYPSAFKTFLTLENPNFSLQIEQDIKALEAQDLADQQMEYDRIDQNITARFKAYALLHTKTKPVKKTDKGNIAFHCIFNDGKSTEEEIGYRGVCSDETLTYNINTAKHGQCRRSDGMCYQYFKGLVTREALDDAYQNNKESLEISICGECQLLEVWAVSPGVSLSGVNKGKPLALKHVTANSLTVLTTKMPGAPEEDRIIFGAFLVDEHVEGNTTELTYLKSNPNYRVQLTEDEAKNLKFWNYYFNPLKPETISFGTGTNRTLTDIQAAQILRDILEMKKGTLLETRAKQFLDFYCSAKQVHLKALPDPSGALKRIQGL